MKTIGFAIALTAGFLAFPEIASSATTGWMGPAQYESHLRKLKAQNRLPVKIECKGTNSTSQHNFVKVRVTDRPNKNRTPWISQINNFSPTRVDPGQKIIDKKRGLKRKIVSHQRFSVRGHSRSYTCHIAHFERIK